jgi:protein-S-isoprenylcysteine O-methyltransferase Ste14
VILSCAAYRYAPFSYHQQQFGELYGAIGFSFTGGQYLFIAAAGYIAILALYFALETNIGTAKALRLFRVAGSFAKQPLTVTRRGLEPADRLAVLTMLLKAFFGPMMVMSLLRFCQGALATGERLFDDGGLAAGLFALLTEHAFWFFMNLILFVDVLLFTVGYLLESPRLRNEIRSVDATLIGWGAALLCYPPFNALTGSILGSNVSDFPKFDDPTVHVVLNALLLVLMAIYASASVALGWKASNLTHRGIIDRGPYRFIRHPAYVCKNMAWWIGSVPLVGLAFGESALSGLLAVASVAGWSMLYVLRALTEEDHLKRVDGEYAKYAARVRWRFIPGLI